MKSRQIAFAILCAGLGITACTSWKTQDQTVADREPASVATWRPSQATFFKNEQLAQISSSGGMNFQKAEVITDNNRAFQSKLEMVKNAKSEINLSYFIFSDDYSSSLLSTELIAAARRGVKVKILVDFITNYGRLDYFQYMESVGNGNLEVRFYGFPQEAIQRGAVYQTVPCSSKKPESATQCQIEKDALIASMGNPKSTWFSRMYLAGVYGRNQTLLQTAVGLGGQFDPKNMAGGKKPTAAEKKKLNEFFKLVLKAKLQNDIGSKIKLGLALQTYGETLNPIMNEITGRLPLHQGGGKEWDHITDYTHHKLLLVDGEKFQLGGRNIEDSYHTDGLKKQIAEASGKYTFMDTDFYAETPSAKRLAAAYERLFRFPPMTGGLRDVQIVVPNEYDVNTEPFKMALGSCMQSGIGSPNELEICVNSRILKMPGYQTVEARLQTVRTAMDRKAREFLANYKPTTDRSWKQGGDAIAPSDLATAQGFYLENLNASPKSPTQRSFGSEIGQEVEFGKGIHAAWTKGLENVCAVSAQSKTRKRVVLHTAYFFMSSNLTSAVGNMINGKWNCSFVDVMLITNSFETTDLNVINVFARYQLHALLGYNAEIEANKSDYPTANQNKARLKYFEYNKNLKEQELSLHSKVSLLGDDVIIGSANGDVRSYYMDTNNAIYLRNVPSLVADYSRFIDQLVSTQTVLEQTGEFTKRDKGRMMYAENEFIMQELLKKWDKNQKVTKEQKERFLNTVDRLGAEIRSDTRALVDSPATVEQGIQSGSAGERQVYRELDQISNKFDKMWKVL